MKKQLFKYFQYTTAEQANSANEQIKKLLSDGWTVKISYPIVRGPNRNYTDLIFIFEKDESITPSIQ